MDVQRKANYFGPVDSFSKKSAHQRASGISPLLNCPQHTPGSGRYSFRCICLTPVFSRANLRARIHPPLSNKCLKSRNRLLPCARFERRIHIIRGQKVMLDSELADLYHVQTFRLNEAVKRNRGRFPEDFMFQLSREEASSLTSQTAISKKRPRRQAHPSLCFHRARRCHAFVRPE